MDDKDFYIAVEGDMRLHDLDRLDKDERMDNRVYCISHKDSHGVYNDLMIVWRRGETIRSVSIGHDPECGLDVRNIMDFAKCLTKAHELLGAGD